MLASDKSALPSEMVRVRPSVFVMVSPPSRFRFADRPRLQTLANDVGCLDGNGVLHCRLPPRSHLQDASSINCRQLDGKS